MGNKTHELPPSPAEPCWTISPTRGERGFLSPTTANIWRRPFCVYFPTDCRLYSLQIIAHGFDRYIRDPWNLLDFVVVVLGYLSLIPQLGNYSAIRALRVFRAFKTINAVPGLQIIVRALTECIKDMLDPMLLIVFCLIFFGIFGLQLYMGK